MIPEFWLFALVEAFIKALRLLVAYLAVTGRLF